MSWIWQGRQLVKAEKDKKLSFTYDSEGVRTTKTVGSTTTKYLLNGTQILAQTTNGTTLSFFYDQQGNRVAMADSGNHFYYYIYNLQGDVIALADASTGKLAVTYTYDAWGKLVKLEDSTSNSVGTQNPFRYRGYYYDTETSLYYLQSRYYDPEVGRLINADAFTSTDISGALSANMFAYCENNPVMRHDPNGEWAQILVGAAIGVLEQFVSDVAVAVITGQPLDECLSSVGTYVSAGLSGAFSTIPGCKAVSRVVQEGISLYVGTAIDTAIGKYDDKDAERDGPYVDIVKESSKKVISKKASDFAAKAARKLTKKGHGIFGFIVDKAGEHADGIVGTVSNIVEKLFGRKR